MDSVTGGGLGFRLEPGSLLAEDFNRMAESLSRERDRRDAERRDAERMLREMVRAQELLRGTLEEKVRERTGDLHKAYEELKKIDGLKDAFISSVSHELRTPLASIRSFSEILLGYDEDVDTRREFLGIIKQESERLTRLINDVLDLSKIELGEMVWEIDAVSLPDLCSRALGTVRVLAEGRKQRLDVQVPQDLHEVLADPDRVIQVLTNLLSNAVKFTPEGGQIVLRADEPDRESADGAPGMVRVMVADDGVGIPPEEISTVFERFKQVVNTLDGKPKGTGLGLPISREIIRHLGGTMWVESDPGKGSRFFFTLPRAQARRATEPAQGSAGATPPPGAQALQTDAQPAGVLLLVAPDLAVHETLRDALKETGVEVLHAASAGDGIDRSGAMRPDLILVRLPMEGPDLPAALRRLREDPRTTDCPVLLLTDAQGGPVDLPQGVTGTLSIVAGTVRLRDEIAILLREHRRWVAVVDDDPGTVAVLGEMLRLRGYGVVSAYDGEEALRAARDRELDLMILDLNMPRKSGWKVLEALRSEPATRSLSVIVLTGVQTEMDRARALALGAVEFLEKGHGLQRLASEIELLVKRRRRAAPGEAAIGGEVNGR
jgi:signal transduction histidine kinase/CheY-like chemotaxis protein